MISFRHHFHLMPSMFQLYVFGFSFLFLCCQRKLCGPFYRSLDGRLIGQLGSYMSHIKGHNMLSALTTMTIVISIVQSNSQSMIFNIGLISKTMKIT